MSAKLRVRLNKTELESKLQKMMREITIIQVKVFSEGDRSNKITKPISIESSRIMNGSSH